MRTDAVAEREWRRNKYLNAATAVRVVWQIMCLPHAVMQTNAAADANVARELRQSSKKTPNATANAAADAHVNAARTVPTVRRNASAMAWMLMLLLL